MSDRKPNNRPWIILGGICGLVLLGLFGFGIYAGAKSVSNEASITIPDFPEIKERTGDENVLAIHVNATNEIFLDQVPFSDVQTLKSELQSRIAESPEPTLVILRMSEKAPHTSLVSLTDMLDDLKIKSMIEIIRSETE